MKITEGQLRRIIRQEVQALRESLGREAWKDEVDRALLNSAPEGSSYGGGEDESERIQNAVSAAEADRIRKAVNFAHGRAGESDSFDIWMYVYDNAAKLGLRRGAVLTAANEVGLDLLNPDY